MNANPTRKRNGRSHIRDKWLADLTVNEQRLGNSSSLVAKGRAMLQGFPTWRVTGKPEVIPSKSCRLLTRSRALFHADLNSRTGRGIRQRNRVPSDREHS